MIVKRLLTQWKEEAANDLEGVSLSQIAKATGISRAVLRNYLSLEGQKTFDPEIIEKINDFRREYKATAAALTIQ